MSDLWDQEEAIAQALDDLERAHATWLGHARVAIMDICSARGPNQHMTTDAVWALLESRGVAEPSENRAMGAAMRKAQHDGLIQPTAEVRASVRQQNHGRRITVWLIR